MYRTICRFLTRTLLFTCFTSTALQAGDFVNPSAKIERNTSGRIRLSLNLARLNVADLASLEIKPNDKSSATNALIKFLDICVPSDQECGASVLKAKYVQNPALDKTPTAEQSNSVEAEIDETSLLITQDINAETFSITVDVFLKSTDPSLAFSSNTKISTRISFGSPVILYNRSNIAVTYSLGVADSVQGSYLVSSKKSLTAAWSIPSTVALSDGSQGTADGILAVLVPKTLIDSGRGFPSRYYQADFLQQSQQADSLCSINLNDAETGCSVSCNDETNKAQFWSSADFTELEAEGVQAEMISLKKADAYTFKQLQPDETYAIILQYIPDGTIRSCLLGKASEAITLIQLETGNEPKIGNPNCFVATAAYGSPLDKRLKSLRWFRDQYLLPHASGRYLVETYYEYGPKAALWIEDKPLIKSMIRALLWLPITIIEHSSAYQAATPKQGT